MAMYMIGYLSDIVIALVEKGEPNSMIGPRFAFTEL